jgi:hypothetical protein
MSYTYGHEQTKKKPSDLFQKLVSQGHSPAKARKLVSYGKKMSGKQQKATKAMRKSFDKSLYQPPKTAPYKSNYLPDLSTNTRGKYGVDY